MSEVIVITSGKGGVGKTTTTANIGTGLAKLHKNGVLPTSFPNPSASCRQSILAPEGKLKLYIYGILLSFCRLPYVQL